jgi:hypothetical protein
MSKTLTSSIQLLNQIKNQYENVRESTFKESEAPDAKNYGSIRRANPIGPTSRNSFTTANPHHKEPTNR